MSCKDAKQLITLSPVEINGVKKFMELQLGIKIQDVTEREEALHGDHVFMPTTAVARSIVIQLM